MIHSQTPHGATSIYRSEEMRNCSPLNHYHPAMLLGLLVYGYATKVFSSRAIERATY
jgi:transposase